MTRLSAATYVALIAVTLFAVFWLNDRSGDQSATMAPDVNVLR